MLNKVISIVCIVWIMSSIVGIITAASPVLNAMKIIPFVVFLAATGLYTGLHFLGESLEKSKKTKGPGKSKEQKQQPPTD